jgi:hypothetical protein
MLVEDVLENKKQQKLSKKRNEKYLCELRDLCEKQAFLQRST